MSFSNSIVLVWLILGGALMAMLRTLKLSEDGPEPEGPPLPELWAMALIYGVCLVLCLPLTLVYFVVGTIAGAR